MINSVQIARKKVISLWTANEPFQSKMRVEWPDNITHPQ